MIVYCLENCPHCEEIKEKLDAIGYDYEVRDMSLAENLTELKMLNCFAMEAPVLQVDDRCFEYADCQKEGFFTELLKMCPDQREIPDITETHSKLKSDR